MLVVDVASSSTHQHTLIHLNGDKHSPLLMQLNIKNFNGIKYEIIPLQVDVELAYKADHTQ